MLVLSRKVNEEIIIAGQIRVKVIEVTGNRIRLGIDAPSNVAVHRAEICRAMNEFQVQSESPLLAT